MVAPPKELPRALGDAISKYRTLGEVAHEIGEIASQQRTLCFENLSKGHQLTRLPIGSRAR
jgi:hypothetical protein